MIKSSSGDTPFSLTYGTKAVIPVEIGMPSLRYVEVNQAKNDNRLLLNLDILEKRREKAMVREARSKAKMEKYYNAKVRSTSFRPGDFVYCSNEASHAKESWAQSRKDHMRYGYIRNHKKNIKNKQVRTRERKSVQKPEAKARKSQIYSQLQSILVNKTQNVSK
ncbi:hypothetical protein Tco_1050550 [Tanacetum coccineum]